MADPPKEQPSSRRAQCAESDLWRKVTRDVKPLAGRDPGAETADSKESPRSTEEKTTPRTRPRERRAEPAPRTRALPELHPGGFPGVDRRTAERFRRGQIPIEAELDLHGLTREQAHVALNTLIARSAGAGKRCLLVVTGKGRRAGVEDGWRGDGVLRDAVPRWLNDPPNRDKILAISYAQPKNGGDGALYVLLKRRRED